MSIENQTHFQQQPMSCQDLLGEEIENSFAVSLRNDYAATTKEGLIVARAFTATCK